MQRLELTLPTAAQNVALDEALLDHAEAENAACEFLRIWESPQPVVVVGRSSRVGSEVNEAACRAAGIAILRRSSGGAAVVAGPGCLMYAVVLSYQLRPRLKDLRHAHAFVLGRLVESVRPMIAHQGLLAHVGTSDLAIRDLEVAAGGSPVLRKFSGNSLRAKRTHLLYHGTLLYEFDLTLIETCLRMPPRQPDYRRHRSHSEFVTNLSTSRRTLIQAVDSAWPTRGALNDWPAPLVEELVKNRFSCESWNFEFR
jgi:lipoate-protein ligase A